VRVPKRENWTLHVDPFLHTGRRSNPWRAMETELRSSLLPLVSRHYDNAYWAARYGVLRGDISVRQLVEEFGTASLWLLSPGEPYWIPSWTSLVLNASFAPHEARFPGPDVFATAEAEKKCFEELADLLPAADKPWASDNVLHGAMSYPVLRVCSGPMASRTGKERSGALLMFLPLAEIMEKSGEFQSFENGVHKFGGRTHGQLRNVVLKFLAARSDAKLRASALATVRGLGLTQDVAELILAWIDRDVDLLAYDPTRQKQRKAAMRVFAPTQG
jgi:hypothetical protein